MCQQILQFCSGVTKPLLFAGGLLSFLLSVAIGHSGFSTNALYNDIDPQTAAARSLCFYLQIAACVYLAMLAAFSCQAAHYDQKHLIRGLAGMSTLNLVAALAAILLIPSGQQLTQPLQKVLEQAQPRYNFMEKYAQPSKPVELSEARPNSNSSEPFVLSSGPKVAALLASTQATPETAARSTEVEGRPQGENADNATRIWDSLQARGCCGLTNGTLDWRPKIPKSCCADPVHEGDEFFCKQVGPGHQQGCLALIESTGLNLLIVLALIAAVNFYLATISGLSAYKTLSYSEASQNAYT